MLAITDGLDFTWEALKIIFYVHLLEIYCINITKATKS